MEHILPCTCMWYKDQSMFQEPPQWFITVSSSQLGNVLNIKITKINCVIINYVQVS
jgi:hypothetical protein